MNSEKVKDEIKILMIQGGAIVGAYIVKRALERILEQGFHKEPPKDPRMNENGWIEAIGWASFTGALAGALKLLVKSGAKKELDKLF